MWINIDIFIDILHLYIDCCNELCSSYIEDIQVFSINTEFILIELYENKYFTSEDSHKWNMILFIPRDENKSRIYRKKLEFSFHYILSVIKKLMVILYYIY